jgi:hypothetical protein
MMNEYGPTKEHIQEQTDHQRYTHGGQTEFPGHQAEFPQYPADRLPHGPTDDPPCGEHPQKRQVASAIGICANTEAAEDQAKETSQDNAPQFALAKPNEQRRLLRRGKRGIRSSGSSGRSGVMLSFGVDIVRSAFLLMAWFYVLLLQA